MATIKCNICGGGVEVVQGKSWGTCDYCNNKVTFPKDMTDQRINLFNRADAYRRQNEFDKAIAAYERILEDDQTDAEAHWGAAISRFGIEYVENPVNGERKPTLHRLQTVSILADEDYKAALANAPDDEARELYEQRAQEIADIQKKALEQSEREDQYDIFISYKETDANGERTPDSGLAYEIYTALKRDGYNIFYARESLKGKLGDEYEPIIFSALRSSQIMILIGTKKEYFEAEWVRNEWSRYLDIIKHEKDKPLDEQIPRKLIPCYRDIDAYQLPVELNMLQSMNMGSINFLPDLRAGVHSIMEEGSQGGYTTSTDEISRLLQRAMNEAEVGEFDRANQLAEKVLEKDPNNAVAQMVKLLVQLKVNTPDELVNQKQPLTHNRLYIMACRNAKGTLKKRYESYNKRIIANIEAAEKQKNLDKVLAEIKKLDEKGKKLSGDDDSGFKALSKAYLQQAEALDQMGDFGGADVKAKECRSRAEEIERDIRIRIDERQRRLEDDLAKKRAVEAQLKREREEREKAEWEAKQAEKKKKEEEEARARRKKARKRLAVCLVILAIAGAVAAYKMYFENRFAYDAAVRTIEQSEQSAQLDYATAVLNQLGTGYQDVPARQQQIVADKLFLGGQKESAYNSYIAMEEKYRTPEKMAWYESQYQQGLRLTREGKYEDAITVFRSIQYYSDAKDQILYIYTLQGDAEFNLGRYDTALRAYTLANHYQDADTKIAMTQAAMLFDQGRTEEAYAAYKALPAQYFNAKHRSWYDQQYENAKRYLDSGEYLQAIDAFSAIRYYNEDGKSAEEQLQNAHYSYASQSRDPALAQEHYALAGDYRDSASLSRQIEADGLFDRGLYEEAYAIYGGLDEKYQTHKETYTGWFEEAKQLLTSSGDIAAAINQLERLAYLDSTEYPVSQLLKTAYSTYAHSLLKPEKAVNDANVEQARRYFELAGEDGADAVWQYYYETGKLALANRDATAAANAFEHINWEQDSRQLMGDYYYLMGQEALNNGEPELAARWFAHATGHEDTQELMTAYYYDTGRKALESGDAAGARAALQQAAGYQDADALLLRIDAFDRAEGLLKAQKLLEARRAYLEVGDYLGAPKMAERCGDLIYENAMRLNVRERVEALETLGDFKDSQQLIQTVKDDYQNAQLAYANKDYAEAVRLFESLGNYSDAETMLQQSRLGWARRLIQDGQYQEGIDLLAALPAELLEPNEIENAWSAYANSMAEKGQPYHALAILHSRGDQALYEALLAQTAGGLTNDEAALSAYAALRAQPDADNAIAYELALAAEKAGLTDSTIQIYKDLGDYADADRRWREISYQRGVALQQAHSFVEAIQYLEPVRDYNKDAESKLSFCYYRWAGDLFLEQRYEEALAIYESLGNYVNSVDNAEKCRAAIAERDQPSGSEENRTAEPSSAETVVPTELPGQDNTTEGEANE